MKILIVDDESHKLKAVYQIAKSVEGVSESNIVHVLDLNNARVALTKERFDLLILDLNMPDCIDGEPQKNGGTDFLDEVIHTTQYAKPTHVVILTEHNDAQKIFESNTDLSGFTVLHFDSNSIVWSNIIKAKIAYIKLCEDDRLRRDEFVQFDVALLTAVPVETKAVYQLLKEWNHLSFENDPSRYMVGEIFCEHRKLSIVHMQLNEMGMSAAATATAKILYHFRPQYIIMVGIAAGIGKSCKIGDILIPCEIWNYSSGKYVPDKQNGVKLIPDIKQISISPSIKEILTRNNFSTDLAEIKSKFLGNTPVHDLSINTDPMACGSAVVASKNISEEMILSHSRKTCGLDMESYGFFYAANNLQKSETIPICIKSVCDFADKKKNDNMQNYAAFTSAEFAKKLLNYLPVL